MIEFSVENTEPILETNLKVNRGEPKYVKQSLKHAKLDARFFLSRDWEQRRLQEYIIKGRGDKTASNYGLALEV